VRIFTRYLGGLFMGPFLFGLGTFSLLVYLGHMFDRMNRLATSPASMPVIGAWLLLQLPYWTVRVIPIATLLAVLFSVTSFVRSGEFVAVQAAGVQAKRFFLPLLLFSAGIGAAGFAAQETILPACFARAQDLWRGEIAPDWKWDEYFDAVLVPAPDRFISTKRFVVKKGTLERPVMDDYGAAMLQRQVDARFALWDPRRGHWVFTEGVIRTFGPDGGLASTESFDRLDSDLRVEPRAMVPLRKRPDEMSMREALAEARRLEGLGRASRRERTALHQKMAYPFTNIILCALGIPVALRLRRAKKPVAFGTALVVSFLYLWFMEMGWMLGKAGTLPPAAAAWAPHIIFGILAVVLYRKV